MQNAFLRCFWSFLVGSPYLAQGFCPSRSSFSCFIAFSSLSRSFGKEKCLCLVCGMPFVFLSTRSELSCKVQSRNTRSTLTVPSSTPVIRTVLLKHCRVSLVRTSLEGYSELPSAWLYLFFFSFFLFFVYINPRGADWPMRTLITRGTVWRWESLKGPCQYHRSFWTQDEMRRVNAKNTIRL